MSSFSNKSVLLLLSYRMKCCPSSSGEGLGTYMWSTKINAPLAIASHSRKSPIRTDNQSEVVPFCSFCSWQTFPVGGVGGHDDLRALHLLEVVCADHCAAGEVHLLRSELIDSTCFGVFLHPLPHPQAHRVMTGPPQSAQDLQIAI